MDSFIDLVVTHVPAAEAKEVFEKVHIEVARLENVLSDYQAESNVGQLNRRHTLQLEPETRELLQYAQQVCRETQGAFDISLRPIKALWGFCDNASPHVPRDKDLRQLLRHVGCDVYRIDEQGLFEWLDPQAEIDLGGIAQGWVAGKIRDIFVNAGIENYLINISGDILVAGARPDGKPWRIGVMHPRVPDSLVTRLELPLDAVTTSGDYEQSFFVGTQRYHHIFDPRTGYPASEISSVSIFSDDPVAADCYATAIFVMGVEKGLEFVNQRDDLKALIIVANPDSTLQIFYSQGWPSEP